MKPRVFCQYCNQPAALVTGTVIYPHRPDLAQKLFYHCLPCEAYVGCHPNTVKPLGVLANAELRMAKCRAHEVFDLIWKEGYMPRGKAYTWLGKELNLTSPHIGEMTVHQCVRTRELAQTYLHMSGYRG